MADWRRGSIDSLGRGQKSGLAKMLWFGSDSAGWRVLVVPAGASDASTIAAADQCAGPSNTAIGRMPCSLRPTGPIWATITLNWGRSVASSRLNGQANTPGVRGWLPARRDRSRRDSSIASPTSSAPASLDHCTPVMIGADRWMALSSIDRPPDELSSPGKDRRQLFGTTKRRGPVLIWAPSTVGETPIPTAAGPTAR